ncbi:Acetylcholinesterase [Cyphellophora attinorum]|uniref:Carboxylic ester hydrolase n=1 Tax=Cyphellophora attinorum TaxID=1664694 RepID=A0A0N1NYS8_9EURO|nr:Acetylcholinesterase [Phialophora attinorum]KPI40373.1 Acetylcholinesterase [Phialophora attinorum]
MAMGWYCTTLTLLAGAGLAHSAALSAPATQIVDLDYAIHQGTLGSSGSYYNFSNIRYGETTTGADRFRAPKLPTSVDRRLNRGQNFTRCPQAHPAWLTTGYEVAIGEPTSALTHPAFNISQVPPVNPEESEDCLFLDVLVPTEAFSRRSSRRRTATVEAASGLPVLVWIDGGGFSAGYKHEMNATGLMTRKSGAGEDFIFVAMNYRVGLFGFLPAQLNGEGDSNAGLLDQRLALQWVQQYIHLFGGDSSRVTIMGESAGGGSVLHQITAYGGSRPIPFQKAILQSPGFQPNGSPGFQQSILEQTFSVASSLTNKSIRSISDLRSLTFEELHLLNSVIVGGSPYGIYTYGPVVDGSFAPDLPSRLIAQNRFAAASLQGLLMGTNHREGILFDSPFLANDSDYRANIRQFFPNMTQADLNYAATALYPNDLSGKYNYTTQPERAAITTAEGCFLCNTRWLAQALGPKTGKIWKYLFAVPPAIHADDLAYSFYNGPETKTWEELPVVEEVANVLQQYIVNFVVTGDPNGAAKEPGVMRKALPTPLGR